MVQIVRFVLVSIFAVSGCSMHAVNPTVRSGPVTQVADCNGDKHETCAYAAKLANELAAHRVQCSGDSASVDCGQYRRPHTPSGRHVR